MSNYDKNIGSYFGEQTKRGFFDVFVNIFRNHPLRDVSKSGNKTENDSFKVDKESYTLGFIDGQKSEQTKNVNSVGLSKSEYDDFMSLLVAFGYQFSYSTLPGVYGMSVHHNQDALDAGVVVPENVKQEVYQLLKIYTRKEIWKK